MRPQLLSAYQATLTMRTINVLCFINVSGHLQLQHIQRGTLSQNQSLVQLYLRTRGHQLTNHLENFQFTPKQFRQVDSSAKIKNKNKNFK